MLKNSIRRRPIVIAIISVLAVSATAFAYWTTTGSGTGQAQTGTNSAVTVTQTSTVSGLYPDGPDRDVDYKITNPASGPQYVATVTASISSVVKLSDGSVATGCTATDFALTQPAAINQDLPPGDTAFNGTKAVKIRMINRAANQDACKSVKVNLAFSAS